MDLTEFLGEFQLEAGEKLDILAGQLLRLERDPTNPSPIREMFLAAHTIKGGAAMLRLTDIEALAHGVEDLLSSLREQHRTLDATAADLLFQSIDRLRELVETSSADAFGADVDARVLSFADELRANARGSSLAATATAAQPNSPRIAVKARGIARALLVDDSPTVRELHRMLLEDAGFEAEACEDGAAALARALAQPFDLIVSGLQNKGLSGFDLTIAIRAHPGYRDVPIILTSADSDPELARRAVESGAHALVRKGALHDERMSDVLREIGAKRAA
jgi:chemotaxis protein histidine kinase CheA